MRAIPTRGTRPAGSPFKLKTSTLRETVVARTQADEIFKQQEQREFFQNVKEQSHDATRAARRPLRAAAVGPARDRFSRAEKLGLLFLN